MIKPNPDHIPDVYIYAILATLIIVALSDELKGFIS